MEVYFKDPWRFQAEQESASEVSVSHTNTLDSVSPHMHAFRSTPSPVFIFFTGRNPSWVTYHLLHLFCILTLHIERSLGWFPSHQSWGPFTGQIPFSHFRVSWIFFHLGVILPQSSVVGQRLAVVPYRRKQPMTETGAKQDSHSRVPWPNTGTKTFIPAWSQLLFADKIFYCLTYLVKIY